jgi:hypothetical protein
MAISGTAYDPKLFQFLIAAQDAYGTINGASGNAYIALDVDSIGSPTLGINQTLDVRSGSRVLLESNFFQDTIASVKEISVSGTATTAALDLMLSHLTLDSSVPYAIATNVATSSFKAGGDTSGNKALSVIMKSAASNSDLVFKDCFITSLTLSGDAGTEGGRVKFSATFQSGTKVASGELTATDVVVDTAITANDYFMSGWDADDRIIAGVANGVISSFSLTVDNPLTFSGIASTGYEQAIRSGEVSATASFSVLYDNNFLDMFERFNTTQAAGATTGATLMNHQAALANEYFGFKFPKSIITEVSFNEGSSMMLDVSVKAIGSGSADLFEIAC